MLVQGLEHDSRFIEQICRADLSSGFPQADSIEQIPSSKNRKSDETEATAAALLSSRATKAEAAAIQRTMLNGWRLSRREVEAWWRKGRLGENFSFSFPSPLVQATHVT